MKRLRKATKNNRGGQILCDRSPGRIYFTRWCLIFVSLHCGFWFFSAFWRLGFLHWRLGFWNICNPLDYNNQHIPSPDRDLNPNMKLIATYRTVSVGRQENVRKWNLRWYYFARVYCRDSCSIRAGSRYKTLLSACVWLTSSNETERLRFYVQCSVCLL